MQIESRSLSLMTSTRIFIYRWGQVMGQPRVKKWNVGFMCSNAFLWYFHNSGNIFMKRFQKPPTGGKMKNGSPQNPKRGYQRPGSTITFFWKVTLSHDLLHLTWRCEIPHRISFLEIWPFFEKVKKSCTPTLENPWSPRFGFQKKVVVRRIETPRHQNTN
jgi:hypothetical protein